MNTILRFHVLGDSLAAGVGCMRVEQSIGYLLADMLRAAGHAVTLGVHAVPGARSADLAPQVRPLCGQALTWRSSSSGPMI